MCIGRHNAKYEIIIKRDCEVLRKVHLAIVSKCIFDDDNDEKSKIVCGYLRSKAGAVTWRTGVSEVRALTPPACWTRCQAAAARPMYFPFIFLGFSKKQLKCRPI